jgi:hypothetical protein
MARQMQSPWQTIEHRDQSMIEKMIRGGLAGLAATGPMTAVMRAGERLVPLTSKIADRGKLPPRQVTEGVLHKADANEQLDERERGVAAAIAHYGFGTTAGALLSLAVNKVNNVTRVPTPLLGAAFGVGVWAASYAGWLPLMGIRRHATEEPAGRNIQMIAAHIVWGAAAGAALDAMTRES